MSTDKYGFGNQFSAGVNYEKKPAQDEADHSTADAGGALSGLGTRQPAPSSVTLDLGTPAEPAPVKDISTAEFMTEVIEGSKTSPVLVDFWAPWCGPCKQLGPALEAAVAKAGGKVRLVKMNIDEHPEVAGQMGIQSIPAVVAFVSGQPKDAFMGVRTEQEIAKFIEKLAGPSGPSKLEEALETASGLAEQGQTEEAAGIYGAILQQQPDNADALAGYGNLLVKDGKIDEAKSVLQMAGSVSGHQGLEALGAAIELAEQADSIGDFGELEARLAADPGDHQARFDLAIALNGAGKREEAAGHLLEIISRDREWQDDGARSQLLKFFESWGPADPATLAARRKLSSLLFS
ncbi:thioredoxin [Salaquimonas pukyongi]|uniref:thioredoxin n=1 Tax=Salaquimonas pukyongi TaxID=2712698 RepID=UPI0009FA8411|nr:thioredoxin [Salaquimonas pukyongi]